MIIGVLGCGNMGGAIVEGLLLDPGNSVVMYDRNPRNQARMLQIGGKMLDSAEQLWESCDVLIVAVHCDKFYELLQQLEPKRAFASLISVMGGVTISQMQAWTKAAVSRAMPNTACSIRKSTTLITPGAELFSLLGDIFVVPEAQFDVGSVLCSCQTAFAMRYVRAAYLAGIKMGMRADDALKISAACVQGAMAAVLAGQDPDERTNSVMTPGGWTIRGICELEACNFTSAVIKGLEACLGREKRE